MGEVMEKINLSRLKNCMARAQRGEELTIGFLGGSITQGMAGSEEQLLIMEFPELLRMC